MIDLCRAVARRLANQLGLPALAVTYVPVTSANRFEAIEKRAADLLCEPTSITLARQRQVDFSVATFVDGAGLMTRDTNLRNFVALSGRTARPVGQRHHKESQNLEAGGPEKIVLLTRSVFSPPPLFWWGWGFELSSPSRLRPS